MTVSNKTAILRIRSNKARSDLDAIEQECARVRKTKEQAWLAYRDAAIAEGACPFCDPPVPAVDCPGHATYARSCDSPDGATHESP